MTTRSVAIIIENIYFSTPSTVTKYCSAKPRGGNCLLLKHAVTAFWLRTTLSIKPTGYYTLMDTSKNTTSGCRSMPLMARIPVYWVTYSVGLRVVKWTNGPGYSGSVIMDKICQHSQADMRHWANLGSMLGRRRRRPANIETTLFQCLVFAGIGNDTIT